MAEMVPRLTEVKQVMVAEQVYSWVVRGEGITRYAKELVDFSKKRKVPRRERVLWQGNGVSTLPWTPIQPSTSQESGISFCSKRSM